MMRHLEDDGDLSLFINNEGQIGITCSQGHQWKIEALPAIAIEGAEGAVPVDDVLALVAETYPEVFGRSE
jgi:hypothetical protein